MAIYSIIECIINYLAGDSVYNNSSLDSRAAGWLGISCWSVGYTVAQRYQPVTYPTTLICSYPGGLGNCRHVVLCK